MEEVSQKSLRGAGLFHRGWVKEGGGGRPGQLPLTGGGGRLCRDSPSLEGRREGSRCLRRGFPRREEGAPRAGQAGSRQWARGTMGVVVRGGGGKKSREFSPARGMPGVVVRHGLPLLSRSFPADFAVPRR